MHTIKASLEETNIVSKYLSTILPANAILFLTGDLASGKTTLAKQIGLQRGVVTDITSPTFSLQHKYAKDLYHYDLYRKDISALYALGLVDEFQKDGLHMVEWASSELQHTLFEYGYKCFEVSITCGQNEKYRDYKIGDKNA